MYRYLAILLLLLTACHGSRHSSSAIRSSGLLGSFEDDYGIRYQITTAVFEMTGSRRYHIIEWNLEKQYLLARNDSSHASEAGLYTRIDFLKLEKMEPYTWAYCFTVYNAISQEQALVAASADRQHPRIGCNGFPFSRMKPTLTNVR